jgi:hypothetical protein
MELLMKSQTVRGPDNQRPTRSAKTRRYVKQTAQFDTRRDGKPLIFGWGGHLSRHEKNQFAIRSVWAITGLLIALMVFILVGFWVTISVIVPSQTISSVNDQNIPQSDYHKMAVFKGELYRNQLNGVHGLIAEESVLQTQINKTKDDNQKALLTSELNSLTQSTIPNIQNLFVQSPLSNEAIQWLQDDLVLRNWLSKQSSTIQKRINPTDAALNKAMGQFKGNFPKDVTYSDFLSSNNVTDDDMRAMMALDLRRYDMQLYQASLIKSPARQVQARIIQVATPADARSIIQQIKHGADFAKLAGDKSLDNTTKSSGGELGWLLPGQYTLNFGNNLGAVVDSWISDPHRKAGDLSPDLTENGTEHVVQIEAIDPSRAVDSTTLQSLQNNTLQYWLFVHRQGYNIIAGNPSMLTDPMNMTAFAQLGGV